MVVIPTVPLTSTGQVQTIQVADRIPPAVRALLPVGQVLSVMSGQDSATGQTGIFVRGAFIPATLPEGTLPGQELRVRVMPSTDALILKLLTDDVQLPKPSTTVEQQLRALLTPRAFEALADANRSTQHALPKDLLPSLTKAVKNSEEVRQLLAQLINRPNVATEDALRSPKRLVALLETLVTPTAPKQQSTSITPTAQPPFAERAALIRLLAAVQESLTAFVGPEGQAHTNPTPPDSTPLLVAAFAYANTLGTTKDLIERLQAKPVWRKPLELLEDTLSSLPNSGSEDTADPELKMLRDLAQSILRDLATLRQSHPDEATTRATLKAAHSRLQAQLRPEAVRLAQQADQLNSVAQEAERALAGQEALNQANPLLHLLGEPAAIFIPVLLPGLFTKWEVLVHPPAIDSKEGENDGHGGAGKALRRVEISITLPHLGAVHADIAYNADEILYHLQVATAEAKDLADRELSRLSSRLEELGAKKVQGVVSIMKPTQRTTSWIHELPRVGVLA